MKHHTQKSAGAIAERHASVLLASTPSELEAAYDAWAPAYDEDLLIISGGGENASALAACRVLVGHVDVTKANLQMLDFGCGTGPAASYLHDEHGVDTRERLDGCDLSSGMLEQAAERGLYRKLIKADFAKSNCAPNSYDVVHASAVFAPGQAPPSTFDNFWSLLKTDGYAVFTIRCEYYDTEEGEAHREKLESMILEQKWELVAKRKRDYLPNDGVMAYVFVLKKI